MNRSSGCGIWPLHYPPQPNRNIASSFTNGRLTQPSQGLKNWDLLRQQPIMQTKLQFNVSQNLSQTLGKFAIAIAVAVAICLNVFIPTAAADAAAGATVFSNNCAACHIGGGNVVLRDKNLKLETLQSFGMDSMEAIMTQVRNGKNAMPPFGGKLTDEQISDVASYVLAQANQGWKN